MFPELMLLEPKLIRSGGIAVSDHIFDKHLLQHLLYIHKTSLKDYSADELRETLKLSTKGATPVYNNFTLFAGDWRRRLAALELLEEQMPKFKATSVRSSLRDDLMVDKT